MTGLGSVLSLQLSSNKHSDLDMPLDASSMICRHVLQIHAIQAFDPETAWLGWETLLTIMTSTHALHTSAAMIASGLTVSSGD